MLIVMTLLFVKENDFFVGKKSIKQKGLTSSCQVYCNVTELLVFVDLPLVKWNMAHLYVIQLIPSDESKQMKHNFKLFTWIDSDNEENKPNQTVK